MKALFRIFMACAAVALIGFMFFNTAPRENEPLKGPNANSNIIPKTELKQPEMGATTRPKSGMSTLIGKEAKVVLERYGKPVRKESSSFGYDWWIYNASASTFFMVGVDNNVVTQVYIAGKDLDASPFKIGQKRDDIYRMTIIDYEVTANVGKNIFVFSMSEEDMQTRLLVKFDGLFAQLYIDRETGELQGIRFTNSKTLVLHQPYEMTYQGELVIPTPPSSFLQQEINEANAAQLDDLINITRVQHDLAPLNIDQSLEEVAKVHSEDMKVQNFLGHESPINGDLKKRLGTHGIEYSEANENLATDYFDAIEVMHGWLNSPEHRNVMLNDRYTTVGSGVFLNYYTQIFLESSSPELDKENKDSEEPMEHIDESSP
ncbi:CAP domain-containing protein [Lysinibacillus sp. Bpr_S20]|uniref:CAP domain-containing protein n=1 Tax=Lysinibacillus sp. Bpr_S20 TaxID=2933964 RepID=UPI00201135D9|nr:CAP domain-containing protein [Lysinibacillus sp. Bpr_S20]MCL1700151.1 CAP domain-containing protein [Lysinibacillus sp. Bpr_S20]